MAPFEQPHAEDPDVVRSEPAKRGVRPWGWVIPGGIRLIRGIEGIVARTSRVGTDPFLPNQTFGWIRELEENWEAIRAELTPLLRRHDELPNFQDISIDQARLTDDNRWKTYFLYAYGVRSAGNCARCPTTDRLVQGVPGMTTAFFSILSPHKHVPEHRGPYKGVLRYHLGLQVPEPTDSCGIKVAGQVAHWREGGSLLFDDTYPHEAWNESDDLRVVLFMDVVRPLPPPVSWLNRLVIKAISLSPYVQDGRRRNRAWEEGFERNGASVGTDS
jgi:ornithine lipid ester-linked acyl 2-hydroxylase